MPETRAEPPFAAVGPDNRRCIRLRSAVCLAALAVLASPAVASAHGRAATVALDYRLTVDTNGGPSGDVHARINDGDRSLSLVVRPGTQVVVLGDLGEPMLRWSDGVWVNRRSPTAQANRLVARTQSGWKRVADGPGFTWHEHRLAPPPFEEASYGKVAAWRVPLVVAGRASAVSGSFWRVRRPALWPWVLGIALAIGLPAVSMRLRPRFRVPTTVGAGVIAGLSGLAAQTSFTLRDAPSGRPAWPVVVAAFVIALIAACWLLLARGTWRAYAAGAVGLASGVLCLSWLGVFLHGDVISALPAGVARLACSLGLAAGLVSLLGVLWVDPPPEVA